MVKVTKINSKVYQIKIIDKEVRDFHGCVYPVKYGSSYNSYLIIDEKIVLVDTIDDIYYEEFLQHLKVLLGERTIDYIVVNHVEPDHSGCYSSIISEFPNAKTYTSIAGEKAMHAHFFKELEFTTVTKNDSVNIGEYTLRFLETPLVHWPDNMFTYLDGANILFSNDAFGQLIVDDVSYDYQVNSDYFYDLFDEYYANIVWPCNKSVGRALESFNQQNWKVDYICPAHGLIIKDEIYKVIQRYCDFVANKVSNKAVIVYETMWGNSKVMAYLLEKILVERGYDVKIFQLSKSRISEVMKELMDAKLVCIGSGNYNNCILPPVADFLERLKASQFTNRKAFVFGSYGWSKATLNNLVERLELASFKVISEPIYIQYVPNDTELLEFKQIVEKLEI